MSGFGANFRAKGRLPAGTMNKTEAAYSAHLDQLRMAGEIQWFAFEGIKLRLADNTFLTVDFFVMLKDDTLEAHDVKGSPRIVTDDARVKLKVAARFFPFAFRMAFPKKGGGWTIEEVGK